MDYSQNSILANFQLRCNAYLDKRCRIPYIYEIKTSGVFFFLPFFKIILALDLQR